MTEVGPERSARGRRRCEPELLVTDAIVDALARREAVSWGGGDPAVRLLAALIDDVDQRRSSVSMTPST